jgi:phage-related protein
MSGFYGADTQQLRGFTDQVQTGNGRLSDLASQITSQINSVEWVGPDADSFRSDFSGRVRGLFDSADGLLDRFRQEAVEHAEEQDEVSDPQDGGMLDAIGDAIGDFLDGVLGVATGIGQGIWDVMNHPLVTSALDTIGAGLSLAEKFMKNPPGWLGVVGKVLAPIGIVTGVNQMINPSHDGWRGVGDRIAGGLSVVAGVAAFVPGGQVVAAIAGGAAALWNAGNWVYDNWEGITSTVSDAAEATGEFVSDAAEATGEFVGDVADGVTDFVGGLF